MAGKEKDTAAISCLLIVVVCVCASCVFSKPAAAVDAAAGDGAVVDGPAHSVAKRHSHYWDSRWRMMTALAVLNDYSRVMVRYIAAA